MNFCSRNDEILESNSEFTHERNIIITLLSVAQIQNKMNNGTYKVK